MFYNQSRQDFYNNFIPGGGGLGYIWLHDKLIVRTGRGILSILFVKVAEED